MSGNASVAGDGIHGDPEYPRVVVDVTPDFTPVTLVLRRALRCEETDSLRAHLRKQAGKELAVCVMVLTSGKALVVRAFSWCDAAKFCLSAGATGGEEDSGIRYFLTVQDRRCSSCGAGFEESRCRPDQWRDWQLTLDEMLSCLNCKTRISRRNFLDPLSPLLLFTE